MKRKIIVFLFVIIVLLISYKYREEEINVEKIVLNEPNKEVKKYIKIDYNNEIQSININDYVIGVTACEMPASFESEALKAFSIVARTYALYKINKNEEYILKTSISDQSYIDPEKMKEKWSDSYDKYYNKIYSIVHETDNKVIKYNNELILALYFSISNGKTENSENVFSQKLDYLVSTDSFWDSRYDYKEEIKKIPYEEFISKIELNNIKNDDILIERTDSGRVSTIKIKDKSYIGTEFRNLFNLKSTDFNIDINDIVIISTKGYGHGVGLSQYGSNAMALLGYTYDDIIKHYYKDVEIMNNY